MKVKDCVEFECDCAFRVGDKLRKVCGILSANIVTATRVRVYFDSRVLEAKRILKLARPIENGKLVKRKRQKRATDKPKSNPF